MTHINQCEMIGMNSRTVSTPQSISLNISFAKALWMYVIVSLFLCFEMAVQVSPSVMAFHLMHDLSIGSLSLGVMSGCYFYTYAAMQIPSGFLFDRFSPRLLICTSIFVCTLGCLLMAFSSDFLFVCLSRLLMGLGSAFAFVSVLVVTKDLFSNKHFAVMTGVTQMLAAFGAMSGQLPISALVDHIGWRSTMMVFASIGLVIITGVYYFLHYKKCEASPVSSVNTHDSLLAKIKSISSNKQTWYVALYACLLWAPMSGFTSLWGVPFLMKVDHFSKGNAALLVSLMWLGLGIVSPLLGYLSTSFKNRKMPLAFSALIGAVAFGFILFFRFEPVVLGILLLIAGGACAGQALSFTVTKENNSKNSAGTAIAMNNMAVVISGALFQPLIGWLLHITSFNDVATLRASFSIILLSYIVAFLVAVFFIKDPLRCKESGNEAFTFALPLKLERIGIQRL